MPSLTDEELLVLCAALGIAREQAGWFLDEIEAYLNWPEMSGNAALQGLITKGLAVRVGLGDQFDLTSDGLAFVRWISNKRVGRRSRR